MYGTTIYNECILVIMVCNYVGFTNRKCPLYRIFYMLGQWGKFGADSDTRNAPQMTERHFVAVRKGLEPSTSGVTGRHSNQLNYRTNAGCFL